MHSFLLDLRLAFRGLAQRPGAALVMIATLSVGLGVNAAIFGALDALVLRPFRFADVDRLVLVTETTAERTFDRANVAPATYADLERESGDLVDDLIAFAGWEATLEGGSGPEQVVGSRASIALFDALGVRPELGRFFVAEDEKAKVAILSDALWRRRFGGDPGVVGRAVAISGERFEVIGVAPRGLHFPPGTEIWAPLALTPQEAANRSIHGLGVFGRLRPGVDLATVQAQIRATGERLQKEYPKTNAGRGLQAMTITEGLRDPGTPEIVALWQSAAGFVLLIGWVNLANLMLARASERGRDLAVLESLGASRGRLLRTLLAEGLVVAVASALLALPIAALSIRLLREAMPPTIRRWIAGWDGIAVDGRILALTFGLALASVVAWSVWPALRALRPRTGGLRGAAQGGVDRGAQRGRSALVVGEVAAGLILLVAASLSARAAYHLLAGPQGYDPDGLLTFRVVLPDARYAEPERQRDFVRRALGRFSTLPEVETVAIASGLPASGVPTWEVEIEGAPKTDPAHPRQADGFAVSPSYFETLHLPIADGRAFASADDADARPVAIVSRALAERYWPGESALGRRLRVVRDGEPWRTVVGISGDHIQQWFARRTFPTVYLPLEQSPRHHLAFALRTRGEPESQATLLRHALREVDPDLPPADVRSQRRAIHESTIGLQYMAAVMGAFALFGLLLVISGVFAVMAYRVNLRRREIGVRVALGASRGDVLALTLGQAARLTAFGLALGTAGSVAVGKVLASLLRGAAELDLALLSGGIGLLAAAMLLAALIPTRRALAIDPVRVLRAE